MTNNDGDVIGPLKKTVDLFFRLFKGMLKYYTNKLKEKF